MASLWDQELRACPSLGPLYPDGLHEGKRAVSRKAVGLLWQTGCSTLGWRYWPHLSLAAEIVFVGSLSADLDSFCLLLRLQVSLCICKEETQVLRGGEEASSRMWFPSHSCSKGAGLSGWCDSLCIHQTKTSSRVPRSLHTESCPHRKALHNCAVGSAVPFRGWRSLWGPLSLLVPGPGKITPKNVYFQGWDITYFSDSKGYFPYLCYSCFECCKHGLGFCCLGCQKSPWSWALKTGSALYGEAQGRKLRMMKKKSLKMQKEKKHQQNKQTKNHLQQNNAKQIVLWIRVCFQNKFMKLNFRVIHICYVSMQCLIYWNDTLYEQLPSSCMSQCLTSQFLFALSPCPSIYVQSLLKLSLWHCPALCLGSQQPTSPLHLCACAPYAEHAVREGFP